MLIGAHVAARGGLHNAVDNALAIGAEVIQTHPTPAQMWRRLRLEESDRQLYLQKYAAARLRGHYLHAVYLINLASPKPELLRSSVASLIHYLEVAAALDAEAVVFHPGSHLGAGFESVLAQVGGAIREVIECSPPGRARLLVENSAGSGGCVGRSFEEVARVVETAGSDRVGVCLDTQHAFASGYELRDPEGAARTLDEFGRLIGFERLGLVHANELGAGAGQQRRPSRQPRGGGDRDGRLPPAAARPPAAPRPLGARGPRSREEGPGPPAGGAAARLAGLGPRRPAPAATEEGRYRRPRGASGFRAPPTGPSRRRGPGNPLRRPLVRRPESRSPGRGRRPRPDATSRDLRGEPGRPPRWGPVPASPSPLPRRRAGRGAPAPAAPAPPRGRDRPR